MKSRTVLSAIQNENHYPHSKSRINCCSWTSMSSTTLSHLGTQFNQLQIRGGMENEKKC